MNKSLILQVEYFLLHFLHWAIFAIPAGFSSTFLLAMGYSNSSVGIVTALFALISFILQPILANRIDQSSKNILMPILSVMSYLVLFCFALIFIIPPGLLAVILFVIIGSLFYSYQPLINSIIPKAKAGGYEILYGPCRAGGCIGYAITSALLGTLAMNYGVKIIMAIGAVLIVLLLLVIHMIQKIIGNIDNAVENKEADVPFHQFLKRHQLFVVLCISVVLIFYSNCITSTYLLQIVDNIGGNAGDMGKMLGFMASYEVIPMVISPLLMKKISKKVLASFSAICFVVKIAVIAMCNDIGSLYYAQALQMLGFPLFMAVMVALVGELLVGKEAVRGQALFIMAITAANILASITGGVVIDLFSVPFLLKLSIVISAIGAMIFIAVVRLDNKRF